MTVVQLDPLTAELVWVVDSISVRGGLVRGEPTGPSSVDWFEARGHGSFPTGEGCAHLFLKGDASLATDRSRRVAYATILQDSGFRVERLALEFEGEPQCVAFTASTTDFPPDGADQASVAFVPGSGTGQLWVKWQAGIWPNNEQYLGKVPLHDTRIQSTGFSWQQLADPTELDTDYSRCQVPDGAPERGRGRLLATASGAVYHAYTNMADDLQVGAEVRRRTYVERLTEPTFSLCLDDSIPGIVTDQNYFDLGDPDLAFDERSRSLFVAYPSLSVSQDWMTVWSEPVDTSEPDPELFQTRYATWD